MSENLLDVAIKALTKAHELCRQEPNTTRLVETVGWLIGRALEALELERENSQKESP